MTKSLLRAASARSKLLAPCLLALLSLSAPAGAYCQATTCSPAEECSPEPETGCAQEGTGLWWARGCLQMSVRTAASEPSARESALMDAVEKAAASWSSISCADDFMPLNLAYLGAISCDQIGFNRHAGNANSWIVRAEEWPYSSDDDGSYQLAHTTPTYDLQTGEIVDADVELNFAAVNFADLENGTPSDAESTFDLESVVLHEMGHLLGLGHSSDLSAVMHARIMPGEVRRELNADDRAGICAIFGNSKADSNRCLPEGGWANDCEGEELLIAPSSSPESPQGCSFHPRSSSYASSSTWLLLLASLALLGRNSRRLRCFARRSKG